MPCWPCEGSEGQVVGYGGNSHSSWELGATQLLQKYRFLGSGARLESCSTLLYHCHYYQAQDVPLSIYVSLSHPWPLISDYTNYIFCNAAHTLLSRLAVRRNFISTCHQQHHLGAAFRVEVTDWQRSGQRETTFDGEQSIHDLTRTPARDDWPVVCEQCQYWFSVRAGDLTGDIQQQQWQQGRDEGGD